MTANRLLIVDDEPAIGAFIGRVAANVGYDILAVSTADKFLEHVRSWRPSHIMMDLQMPVVDGLALLSQLAAEKCKASIILISGVDRSVVEAARRIAIERGLDVVSALTKPIRVADLTEILNELKREEPWLTVASLSDALARGELYLSYQPKVALQSGEIRGVEAQGYFISRPVAAGEVPAAIERHKDSDWVHGLQSQGGQAANRAANRA